MTTWPRMRERWWKWIRDKKWRLDGFGEAGSAETFSGSDISKEPVKEIAFLEWEGALGLEVGLFGEGEGDRDVGWGSLLITLLRMPLCVTLCKRMSSHGGGGDLKIEGSDVLDFLLCFRAWSITCSSCLLWLRVWDTLERQEDETRSAGGKLSGSSMGHQKHAQSTP